MRKCLTSLLALLAFGSAFAEENAEKKEEFTPNGHAFGQIHANYHQVYEGDSLTANGMELSRAYFGYGYSLSENWSAKVKIDVSSYGNSDYSKYREAFLKEASVTYKKGKLQASGGLIGLVQHKLQEKYWGHRYVYKSLQDAQKMSHSADIGLLLEYSPTDMLSIDYTVRNGEGYKHTQEDMNFKNQLGVTVTPAKIVVLRVFGSFMADTVLRAASDIENPEIIYGGFAGIKASEKIMAGAEYTFQNNAENKENSHKGGVSVYATYMLNKKIEFFGRFDATAWLERKTEYIYEGDDVIGSSKYDDDSKSNNLIILGAQYQPFKKVKFALDYQRSQLVNTDADAVNGVYLHTDIKF